MQIFRALDQIPPDFGSSVVTIGNFDGVHRGHQSILAQVCARAAGSGSRSLAITFDPHPVRVLRPDAPHSLITPGPLKLDLLAKTGIDATLVLPFDQALAALSPEQFISQILAGACRTRTILEGEDFRFGYRGAGSMRLLAELGPAFGFTTEPVTPLILRGAAVSSSRIRNLIAAGELPAARALLGRPYTLRGTPASGRGFGTRYTVPTINLAPYPELIPAHGVYITVLHVNGEPFHAVTNVGNRPTFGADSFTIESHLLNFHPVELQEATPLSLTFLQRLRAEQRFPNPEALLAQIRRDVARAERYFHLCDLLQRRTSILPVDQT